MSWDLFVGDGIPRREQADEEAWRRIPPLRSWRIRTTGQAPVFEIPKRLAVAVNAALRLRRPLLITGGAGSGKSTLIDVIAAELELGEVLRWHITSKTTLNDGLYEYDALGRLQATQEQNADDKPERFVTLGPLGTALAADSIRAVLIDEIDKSDLDLPGDLLNVIEGGEFTIPVLARSEASEPFTVKGTDGQLYTVNPDGKIVRNQFPIIVFTSNGERAFPAPFLRRCIRFRMPRYTDDDLVKIVKAHLDEAASDAERDVITEFARRLEDNRELAVNQILEYVYIVTGEPSPDGESRENLRKILLEELSGT